MERSSFPVPRMGVDIGASSWTKKGPLGSQRAGTTLSRAGTIIVSDNLRIQIQGLLGYLVPSQAMTSPCGHPRLNYPVTSGFMVYSVLCLNEDSSLSGFLGGFFFSSPQRCPPLSFSFLALPAISQVKGMRTDTILSVCFPFTNGPRAPGLRPPRHLR